MTLLHSLPLPLGTPAIDFTLPATDGKNYSLSDFANRKALVIIFMCNHCPYVKAVLDRLIAIQEDYASKGVQLIGINSNDPVEYPEDSLEAMQQAVREKRIKFPYLVDETQEVARAYQAQCTPDIYVFARSGADRDPRLRYHGRLDDNWKEPEKVTQHELRDALNLLLADKKVLDQQRPSMGCSIKWKQ